MSSPRFFPATFTAAILLLAFASAARAIEHATYNSAGALTGLIHDGVEIPVTASWQVELQGGFVTTLQPHDQKSPVTREGATLNWQGHAQFPNQSGARFTASWHEQETGATVDTTAISGIGAEGIARPELPLDLATLEYVIDVPRNQFVGGRLQPGAIALTPAQPSEPTLVRTQTDRISFTDAEGNWSLAITLGERLPVTVTDRWTAAAGRSYHVAVQVRRGSWAAGDAARLEVAFALAGHAMGTPARITVQPSVALYPFDGFGGNYCFGNDSAAAAYTFEHLDVAWARCEFKAAAWDHERQEPGPRLITDFTLMRKLTQRKIPWILSLWRLPERYYADANRQPPGTFGRKIAPERWPEFVELLGSFLVYAKTHYAAEPDFFSFNEPDLGVDLGFTPETHRDTIKRLGAEFERLGLKTKLLLGDTANPRDSHKYVLATAADPVAMRYVGALSVHSWGNGSPEQYRAWADVAAWLHRPLIVAEAGVDPGAYRNLAYDSFAYGLREMQQYHELLRYARPTSLLYWEYTQDYALVHVGADHHIEPTGRFWMIKQFSDLSPRHGSVVASESDRPDVFVTAFTRDGALVVHVLNTGPARTATLQGLTKGAYDVITTTETRAYEKSGAPVDVESGPVQVALPARSFLTFVRRQP